MSTTTARLLGTGARSSFTAIARCRLLFQSKGKSSAAFANRGRQDGSHTPTVSLSPKIFARPFHASAVCRDYCKNLDYGIPCSCDDCINAIEDEREMEPICEICHVNRTAHEFEYEDHDSPWGYSYTAYCEECVEKMWEREKEAKEKIAAAHRDRVNKMLEHVKSLQPGEQVPIAYAVDKVSSIWSGTPAARRHRALREMLSEELQIVKVGNRWKCDKGRVNAMDFDLWRSLLGSYTPR
ncbi:hypothetical protein QBC32DRAFT_81900 [Pseudoneurospora amorphoporcata]|uniref:Uncharacterized protein n=1 Tax=Pseudoneurospora amorphoporcata TaxID=241081 RepID=A0AAN6SIE9_9PEZI|nr:hypothetical protein QBC32DRAFT_81900 [Pseudoneurospora amorphoporcata]